MKTVTVKKNRVFVYYEMSDKTCEEILNKGQSSLRFDLVYGDEDTDFKSWRGVIEKDENGDACLEIKDYSTNDRVYYSLDHKATVLDASTFAMNHVWEWIVAHEDQFPPTSALPIIEN